MSRVDDLAVVIRQAHWSLEEAAHLVHEHHPINDQVQLDPKSNDSVCRTYFWLKKEHNKNRLVAATEEDGDVLFLPGTIMRHLEEKGRYVSDVVFDIYNIANGYPGRAGNNKLTKELYLKAADLIWKQAPNRPAAKVAADLKNFSKHFPKENVFNPDVDTIRKWLRGRGPNKKGRPSRSADNVQPDLKLVIDKLSSK